MRQGEVWHIDADVSKLGGGSTKTAKAVNFAFDLLEKRKAEHTEDGTPVRAQVIVVMTDGHANDSPEDTRAAVARRIELEKRSASRKGGDFGIFGVAIGPGADMELLSQLTGGEPLVLADLKSSFKRFWHWVYKLTRVASQTHIDEEIDIPNPRAEPDNPDGWGIAPEKWQKLGGGSKS
jgi:uncharacterized protein YegL